MADFTDGTTAGVVTTDVIPALSNKMIQVRVPATFVWGTDSIIVDLTKYGCRNISGFVAFEETTAGSIIVAGTGTTSVTTGTLTYVSTGSAANTVGGTLIIFGYA